MTFSQQLFHENYGVYRIVAPSGSCYIGMTTVSFEARWKGHLKVLRSKKHHCRGLQRAFDKYGERSLVFEVLEIMTGYGEHEILYRERQWWLNHKPWTNVYNGEPSGRGSVIHTEESRKKQRESLNAFYEGKRVIDHIKDCIICGKAFCSKKSSVRTCSRSCGNTLAAGKLKRKIDKSDLERLYLNQRLSLKEIGQIYGVSAVSIYNKMKAFGVPRRKQGGHPHK